MSQILVSSLRGTKSNFSENVLKKFVTENKQLKSYISKKEEGQKISSCKGTKSLWIKQQSKKTHLFPFKQILVINRGTRQIII